MTASTMMSATSPTLCYYCKGPLKPKPVTLARYILQCEVCEKQYLGAKNPNYVKK